MLNLKRRIIALLLSLLICVSLFAGLTVGAAGYTPQYTAAAETLYELGLFKGMGRDASGNPNFALDQKATRLQGLVMLLRLLGKEEAALAYTGDCPFADVPAWGKPYVGYAYANKLTKGTSSTTFTPDGDLLGKAYLTFVLRALGYDDAAGDFSYNEALTKAKELSLISGDAYNGAIYRDDCAYVSLKALTTVMKGGKQSLAAKLVEDGVLPAEVLKGDTLTAGLKAQKPVVNATEIPLVINNGTVYLDSQKIKAAFPETEYVIAWNTNSPEKRIAIMGDPYRYFLTQMLISGYVNFGDSLSSGFKEFGTMVSDGFTVGGGDKNRIVFVDLFDKDYNFIAYCAVTGDGSKVYPTTVCTEKYMDKLQADLKALEKVQTLNNEAVYLERTVTFFANGTNKTKTLLCLNESKVSFDASKVAKYEIAGNSATANVNLKDCWFGMRGRGEDARYHIYGTTDVTMNLPWLLSDVDTGSSRTLILIDSNKNVLGFASLKKAMSITDYADFGSGKEVCTIAEKAALDLLTKTADSVGGDLAETAKNAPYSDAALTMWIYRYRTENCTEEEFVAGVTQWLNG